MGGSDQWGNIINGVDLSHRMGGPQLYALTTPLLTKSSGEKMGKSASGAVWLNGDLFRPYDFWQYFRNTEDADVGKFLKIFTRLPLDEIAQARGARRQRDQRGQEDPGDRSHRHRPRPRRRRPGCSDGRRTRSRPARSTCRCRRPTVSHAELANGLGILAALVTAGLAASNGEARRHIQSGAVRVNDAVIDDDKLIIGDNALLPEGVIKLSVGKKKHALIKPV